ncbi:uncharacterized protein [Symphalangus syndactylus]|uniref:uncharacterized protein n=1 Tax=Symphalangus syndactylus TaxID=9590 RepID=UPI0024430317|nr:uncharacterized protein LOC129459588 [Symphalangus syndactylus]
MIGAPSVAQSCSKGSMVIDITAPPYLKALAEERSIAPLQMPHTTSLAPGHSSAPAASGTVRSLQPVPTVLSTALKLSQDAGIMPSGATGDQAELGELDEAVSQVSGSSGSSDLISKARVIGATPWMYPSPLGADGHDHRSLSEKGTLPQGQTPLFREVAPSHASGMVPVPFQALGLATKTPSVYQQGSVVHVIPQNHSQGTVASNVVSGSPQLACGSSEAFRLLSVSVGRMGNSSLPQRSGTASIVSHVPPYSSSARRASSSPFQTEVVPNPFQKTVSGNLAQSSCWDSMGPKNSYRSVHGRIVPELLESSVARVRPFQYVQRQPSQASARGGANSTHRPSAEVRPVIRTGEMTHSSAIPPLALGVRRASLGYESSPSGSLPPLF